MAAGVNNTNFDEPHVAVNIVNNTTTTPALQGTIYAGLYSNNRGPAYRQYSSYSDLKAWAGDENPSVSIGLGSVYDLLSQSSNVLGVRILQPYNATSNPTGDAFAYAIYGDTGWVQPSTMLGSNEDYNFTDSEAFIITGVAQGTYYNYVSVRVTKSDTASGYNIAVYDENGVQQEYFYVTFGIYADGTDADTFASAVVNPTSKYIQIFVNYAYFISQGSGVLPNGYYLNQYPSNGVSSILNWSSTSSFYNYTTVHDVLGNIYISCGLIENANGSSFNTSIVQYNSLSNTWLQLPNTRAGFSFTQSKSNMRVASAYSNANGGNIYSFLRSGGVDYAVNSLSAGAVINNIQYDENFIGSTVAITLNTSTFAWEVYVDSLLVGVLPSDAGTYNNNGLSFTYAGLTALATGTLQFFTNRLHCLLYSLSSYQYTDVGLVSMGGFLASPEINIVDAITLSDGNLMLVGHNNLLAATTFYYYQVSNNSIIQAQTTLPIESNLKLLMIDGSLYMLGGYDVATSTYDKNIYLVTYNVDANVTTLSVALTAQMQTPSAVGFIGAASGVSGSILYTYGGCAIDNTGYVGNFYVFNLNSGQIIASDVLSPYATVSKSISPAAYAIFTGDAVLNSSGMVTALGSTSSQFSGQYNGAIQVSNSLIGTQQLVLGQDAAHINDSAVINTIRQLYDVNQFPEIDVIADCGFNSAAVSIALDNLMSMRQQGVAVLSMPTSYERSETACVLYRQSLNINDGYSFLVTPGQYVRINAFTGNYDLFPISGAVAADFCKQDNQNGPWQSPAGPTNGLLTTVIKLPPAIVGTPLTVPYKEISYDNPALLGANQVNIVGRYSTQFPGIYLKNDQVLDSVKSILQSVSSKRLVLYVASNAQQMAQQFLFLPNNSLTRTKAYTLFDDWLGELLGQQGAIYTYRVICDSSNNPPVTVNQGILNIDLIIYPQVAIRGIIINVVANKVDNTTSIATATLGG